MTRGPKSRDREEHDPKTWSSGFIKVPMPTWTWRGYLLVVLATFVWIGALLAIEQTFGWPRFLTPMRRQNLTILPTREAQRLELGSCPAHLDQIGRRSQDDLYSSEEMLCRQVLERK
jgi:hypothetical protein